MGRRKPQDLPDVERPDDTPFRKAERFWKNRRIPLDTARAFDPLLVRWSEDGIEGVYCCVSTGESIECRRTPLEDLSGTILERSTAKGKQKEDRYAITFPTFPGLILMPELLDPTLQRSLVRESLRHTRMPNLTSLSPHYDVPDEGLWQLHESGEGSRHLRRRDREPETIKKRVQVDFAPVDEENWHDVKGRGESALVANTPDSATSSSKTEEATVDELLSKLRWTNIGWHYDWTSKCYDLQRGAVPLPPMIQAACCATVAAIPWCKLPLDEDGACANLKRSYAPDAGIINFYQLKDSLTAHIDQSEVNAVRPLVSLSIGHSAIFLVGGTTREKPPLAILLRSGDGLIMSGRDGRRVFHGLPRVLEEILPPELKADNGEEDWHLFGRFLERGVRININVREVF